MIPLAEAAKILGVKYATVFKNEHYALYKKRVNGKWMIDLDAFKKDKEKAQQYKDDASLLVEYLHHEHDIKYSDIAKISEVHIELVCTGLFGCGNAKKIYESCKKEYAVCFKSFLKYYNMKSVA